MAKGRKSNDIKHLRVIPPTKGNTRVARESPSVQLTGEIQSLKFRGEANGRRGGD
jgi:hypothetical protein